MQQCNNPVCAQYKLQHRNMTLKTLDMEKELERLNRLQMTHYNHAVTHNALAQVRDLGSGDMGLRMPNGEVMTQDKVLKKIAIAAKCMETAQAYEKSNRQLTDENKTLKLNFEKTYNEMRRLEQLLSGFERTRKYETFTDEAHKETLALNEELADEVETLERRVRRLEVENASLRRKQKKEQKRRLEQEDEEEPVLRRKKLRAPCGATITKKARREQLNSDDEQTWEQIPTTPQFPRSPEAADVVEFSASESYE